jgi:predicted phage terminase large subunit-like protein
MAAYQWNAQYMQAPSAEEAALVKREWWMPWKEDDPPRCDYVIMALDAAAESHNRADFTAITTWGVFSDDKLTDGASHLILLNAVNVRVEFPELKELALREYKEWEPDAFIVEKKSAGTQLYQELRRIGVPVQEFTPGRNTGDKIARMNAISDIIRSGMVWYPEGRRWAEQVIEQCVSFPYGSNDDLVDTTSMALARFRQGGFISLPSDFKDKEYLSRRTTYY